MMPKHMNRAATAVAFAAILLSGCSSGGDPAGPPGDNVVEIRLTTGLRFSPADVTIDPGTSVRWVNDASMLHTVTPDSPGQAGVWAAAQRATPGIVLTHTFNTAGQVYNYHCDPHLADGMVGVIRVR
jgi:plastocyanin